MLFALLGIALGTFVRSAGALPVALVGTVLLGLSVGVGNVAAPVAIGRDFPARSGPVTGVYTASLNVGSMLASLLTAPLADVVGWRWALASWSAVALVAAAVWWIVGRRVRPRAIAHGAGAAATTGQASAGQAATARASSSNGARSSDGVGVAMWRRPVALLLTAAFACQSFGYYGITAWLPSLLADERGLSRAAAGVSSSVFQVLGIIGAISVPFLIHRGFCGGR